MFCWSAGWITVWPFSSEVFAVVNARYPIAAAYNRPEKSLEAQRWICEQYGWVFIPMLMYADYGAWAMKGWSQIFFYDPAGNIIEVHQVHT